MARTWRGVQQEWLYRDALVDVSDIAEEVGKQQGGWYDEIKRLSIDKGKWKTVPNGNIGQLMNYRKDWFDEAGVKSFPETWDEFLEAGIKLKAKGHPFGMSMGHGFADNYSWLYPLLWSYGVTVMDKDGKKVALDSSETAKAVEYVKRLYKEACIEDCIGWLDPHNNKAFLTSQISCTNNAYSIMVSAKRDLPEMGKVIEHGAESQGPQRPALPRAGAGDPRRVRLQQGPAGGQGFPALDDGPEAVPPVDRLGRHVLRSVPARLRQGAGVGHRAARQAVPEGARDRQAHVVAGARQSPARRSDQPLDRDRHVHQGHHRHADQDRHRGGGGADQDHLRIADVSKILEASRAGALAAPARRPLGWGRLRAFVERESVFSWLMLTPPLLFLLLFLGYPFFYGVYLSFFHKEVARAASFVGFGNFVKLYNDPIFWQSVRNTIIFTGAATILKASGGLAMALVMNQDFRMKAVTRAMLLLPFIVPTVLSTVAWQWILDPGMGLFNRLLVVSGLATTGPSWLGTPTMAMISIIMVNTWRGLPFFGISILAGLQTIPVDLHESATIDGAGTWGRFRYVTLPSLLPVIFIVTTFSIVITFFDFQLVYVLTGGGPANSTHLMATYAYSLSMGAGQMGLGSAVALSMVPVLGLLLVLLTLYVRKD